MKKLFTLLACALLISACSASTPITKPSSNTVTTIPAVPKTDSATSFSGSLADLLGMSDSKKCTMTIPKADGSISGTYYISEGKVRGTMLTSTKGTSGKTTQIEMNTLVDKEYMYFWMDKPIAYGSKTSLTKLQEAGKNLGSKTPTTTPQVPDLASKQLYDCQSWIADPSMFVVPTNINFTSN